jgi:hypothetical protein
MIVKATFGRVISGLLPIKAIDELEQIPSLQYVVPAYKPWKNVGKVNSEGDSAMRSSIAKKKFEIDGLGVKIGILSDSYDNLHGASSRMRLYQVGKITKSIRKLTEINLEACQNIDSAVKELRNLKNFKVIKDACARINKLENKSDNVYNKAVFEIFENETDAKNIIKYKEVLSVLESATDKCKSVANILESISVKHS